ncbi:MAG: DivIVA domain-containing protein [Propionibacteriaceae bacterium]|nr:DivIVA domain-containing protein [Propionibacteriaceae bacterium]
MVWFIVVLAVVVIAIAWLAAQGRLGGMPPMVDDRPGPDLPDSDLRGDDLRRVRIAVTSRGYSMQQVDALLERVANQLDGRSYHPVDEHAAWEWPSDATAAEIPPADNTDAESSAADQEETQPIEVEVGPPDETPAIDVPDAETPGDADETLSQAEPELEPTEGESPHEDE